jgi:hypothetical protein
VTAKIAYPLATNALALEHLLGMAGDIHRSEKESLDAVD